MNNATAPRIIIETPIRRIASSDKNNAISKPIKITTIAMLSLGIKTFFIFIFLLFILYAAWVYTVHTSSKLRNYELIWLKFYWYGHNLQAVMIQKEVQMVIFFYFFIFSLFTILFSHLSKVENSCGFYKLNCPKYSHTIFDCTRS